MVFYWATFPWGCFPVLLLLCTIKHHFPAVSISQAGLAELPKRKGEHKIEPNLLIPCLQHFDLILILLNTNFWTEGSILRSPCLLCIVCVIYMRDLIFWLDTRHSWLFFIGIVSLYQVSPVAGSCPVFVLWQRCRAPTLHYLDMLPVGSGWWYNRVRIPWCLWGLVMTSLGDINPLMFLSPLHFNFEFGGLKAIWNYGKK